jgi:SAM-dependent methyltransferase
LRNRGPIAEILSEWLPENGLVLEIASGTGEHAVYFAERFPGLEWQPSDTDPGALASIRAWSAQVPRENLREPIVIDAASPEWPIGRADAVLNINMVHISPWGAALGLIAGVSHILPEGGLLVLYGPWLINAAPTAESNLAFDADLRRRDPEWGLRWVEDFAAAAALKGLKLVDQRQMPANNLMLLFRKETG